MRWLKDQIHRNRWLSGVYRWAQERQRDRSFAAHLHASIGAATRWKHRDEAIASAREALVCLLAIPIPAPRKGSPSKVAIRSPDLTVLDAVFNAAPIAMSLDSLQAAERLASIDPADQRAFRLFLAAYWLHHESIIATLRSAFDGRVVLHMSCASRLVRAQLSVASFAGDAAGFGHLKLIGSGDRYSFDRDAGVLAVSAPDSYECLPQKVFQGLALLTLACNPPCVLKLDDDHRMKNAAELEKLCSFATSTNEALQLGEVNFTDLPSAHHRAWHFGKCARQELNSRPLAVPAPARWAAGSSGYILNRAALWRILWASLYYDRWLQEILYEDVALAEVAGKTGIRIVNAQLSRAIGAVPDY